MDKNSVLGSFLIYPADIGQLGFAWDNENKTLTITHADRFEESGHYTITVSTLARDMSGNYMEEGFQAVLTLYRKLLQL